MVLIIEEYSISSAGKKSLGGRDFFSAPPRAHP